MPINVIMFKNPFLLKTILFDKIESTQLPKQFKYVFDMNLNMNMNMNMNVNVNVNANFLVIILEVKLLTSAQRFRNKA